MGLFDKIINGILGGTKEEREQKKEEERKKQEEANRFNPVGKRLEWFCSEDGIKTFNEYITIQNYFLEETIKKEQKENYDEYSLDLVVDVVHKGAKIPYIFFKNLIKNIDAQPLEYVGPIDMVVEVLSIQAKPFYIDDDGEPQSSVPSLTPEEIVSVEKNPVLNYVSNFKCFELKDDVQGSWDDKWTLWSDILIWLGIYSSFDKEFLSNNSWVFSKEVYFNDLGTLRKPKGFYKKCIELATQKEFFEKKLEECE